MSEPLLDIRGLKTHFSTEDGMVHAVDGVDLAVDRGETLGVVGESGCGKTVTAMSVLKLIAMPPGRIVEGKILWRGRDLVPLPAQEMDRIRGKEIAIVFQEPMTSLNPVYTIGEQIAEVIRRHEGLGRRAALGKAVDMLRLVQIPNPERRVHDFPHQFSGGMRQRAMIAMALSCSPKLLIADEPTTALDVTIQAQILELMAELQDRSRMAIQLISHNLGVVSEIADDIIVMYAGRIVERATAAELFANPRHPYTIGLIETLPSIEHRVARLSVITGSVPDPARMVASGSRFAARCPRAIPACREAEPPLVALAPGHLAACIRAAA